MVVALLWYVIAFFCSFKCFVVVVVVVVVVIFLRLYFLYYIEKHFKKKGKYLRTTFINE